MSFINKLSLDATAKLLGDLISDEQNYTGISIPLERKSWRGQARLGFSSTAFSQLINTSDDYLHTEELMYLENLTSKRLKHMYLLGRYTAKQTLAHYYGKFARTNIAVIPGVFRQPIVMHPDNRLLGISITHTSCLGGCVAFSLEHPMGIDIENLSEENVDSVVQSATKQEIQLYRQSEEEEVSFFTRLWTAKEALSKILHTGLMTPMAVYEVSKHVMHENYVVSYFTNFAQYKAISFRLSDNICSIVLPEKTNCFPSKWINIVQRAYS